MDNEERFKINDQGDRERMIIALANAGYSVRLEKSYNHQETSENDEEYWIVISSFGKIKVDE